MDKGVLAELFERHFRNWRAALDDFRLKLRAADLDFSLEENVLELPTPEQPGFPAFPSAIYYFVPGSGFGSIKKEQGHPNTSDGVGLNMGCPVRLARALDVLFSLSVEDRRETLLQIKSRENHFAAVEETLWLTLWHPQSGITRGGTLLPLKDQEKPKDIDWFFFSDGMPIYLEAKFRKVDWMRLSDQEHGKLSPKFFKDIGSKFPSEPSVFRCCVAAITGFAEPDDSFFARCEKKLLSTPGLNAILFKSLLGPVAVCSLDPATVLALAVRIRGPSHGEYPLYYRVQFNRVVQEKRISGKCPANLPEKGLLFYTYVPGPIPTFRPKYPMRGKIPQWSATGMPKFEVIPPFITKKSQ